MTTATSHPAGFAHPAPALRDQVLSLGRHLSDCRRAQGPFSGIGHIADAMHGWVAPRFVTTLALAAVLFALACS